MTANDNQLDGVNPCIEAPTPAGELETQVMNLEHHFAPQLARMAAQWGWDVTAAMMIRASHHLIDKMMVGGQDDQAKILLGLMDDKANDIAARLGLE